MNFGIDREFQYFKFSSKGREYSVDSLIFFLTIFLKVYWENSGFQWDSWKSIWIPWNLIKFLRVPMESWSLENLNYFPLLTDKILKTRSTQSSQDKQIADPYLSLTTFSPIQAVSSKAVDVKLLKKYICQLPDGK